MLRRLLLLPAVLSIACTSTTPAPGSSSSSTTGGQSTSGDGGVFTGSGSSAQSGSSSGASSSAGNSSSEMGLSSSEEPPSSSLAEPSSSSAAPSSSEMPDAGVAPQDICTDVATRKCDFEIRCLTDEGSRQGRANDQIAASERATCIEMESSAVGCGIGAKSWELGRSNIDQAAYDACLTALYPPATCARDLHEVLRCATLPFITPNTTVGMLCTSDLDCVNGWCSVDTGNACGICAAKIPDNNRPCTRQAQCGADSWCDVNRFGATNTCRPHAALDAPCDDDRQCASGTVCAFTGVGFNRACKTGKPEGATCNGGRYECLRTAGALIPELLCSTATGMGTCIDSQADVGGGCGTGERLGGLGPQAPFCRETEFCVAGLCTPKRVAGQPCQSNDQCSAGTFCNNTGMMPSNTCVAFKEQGEACSGDAVCKNLLACQGATCQPSSSTVGEPCNMQVPCANGWCTAMNTCAARKEDGATCVNDAECISNDCTNGTCADACWD